MDKWDGILSKYAPLKQMLLLSAQDNVNMGFGEIETILGFSLSGGQMEGIHKHRRGLMPDTRLCRAVIH